MRSAIEKTASLITKTPNVRPRPECSPRPSPSPRVFAFAPPIALFAQRPSLNPSRLPVAGPGRVFSIIDGYERTPPCRFRRVAAGSRALPRFTLDRNSVLQSVRLVVRLVPKLCLGTVIRETRFRATPTDRVQKRPFRGVTGRETEFRGPAFPNRVWERGHLGTRPFGKTGTQPEGQDRQGDRCMLVDLPNLSATEALGRRLGAQLRPGMVVALIGPLGAGKTHLSRAIAGGLGLADSRVVCSPTFVLLHEYAGRVPIYHFDAYRLRSEEEFNDLGAGEYLEADGVCLIEWADRVARCLPADYLRIELRIVGETARQASVEGMGERTKELVGTLDLP
jgi:tRNA threonylcarbamoyladenosine biosynthesis protein TsaE